MPGHDWLSRYEEPLSTVFCWKWFIQDIKDRTGILLKNICPLEESGLGLGCRGMTGLLGIWTI
jgi:hypothetical protein